MQLQSPVDVVQAQFAAYNAKDIDALLATYAPDAEHFALHGERLAAGHAQLRARFERRFAEPNLHARLLSRVSLQSVVVDHELITRNFPAGIGTVEMLCIYEVEAGKIRRASFVASEERLLSAGPEMSCPS